MQCVSGGWLCRVVAKKIVCCQRFSLSQLKEGTYLMSITITIIHAWYMYGTWFASRLQDD